ncbi:MAG: thiamine biosynthesis protein ThiJ [Gemmatimonadetes bacterium RIFCSPLOWO2_12_FULL_68_9]|nr:MAG: thiamine biosynthesis protein ThiJ [Gemmatimonadetes bacterium RIFCSPLOWO2_12_FULL_68_9]
MNRDAPRIAFVVYDRMTVLDFIGIYDPLTRLKSMGFLPALTWDVCAMQPVARDDRGLSLNATRFNEPLGGYHILVVPGGFGARTLKDDPRFVTWLKTAAPADLKVSVCTGALLLGAAGFLRDKRATTHPAEYDALRPYCAEVVAKRIVDAGNVITAGGVTSAIDVGLYVVERLAGPDVRHKIARQMDYPYALPPDSVVTPRP